MMRYFKHVKGNMFQSNREFSFSRAGKFWSAAARKLKKLEDEVLTNSTHIHPSWAVVGVTNSLYYIYE